MNGTIQCPACKHQEPEISVPNKGQLATFSELFDTTGWKLYREGVRQEVMRAVDRLLCEQDPAKLLSLRAIARAMIHFSQFEDRMRAMLAQQTVEADAVSALLTAFANEEG